MWTANKTRLVVVHPLDIEANIKRVFETNMNDWSWYTLEGVRRPVVSDVASSYRGCDLVSCLIWLSDLAHSCFWFGSFMSDLVSCLIIHVWFGSFMSNLAHSGVVSYHSFLIWLIHVSCLMWLIHIEGVRRRLVVVHPLHIGLDEVSSDLFEANMNESCLICAPLILGQYERLVVVHPRVSFIVVHLRPCTTTSRSCWSRTPS